MTEREESIFLALIIGFCLLGILTNISEELIILPTLEKWYGLNIPEVSPQFFKMSSSFF